MTGTEAPVTHAKPYKVNVEDLPWESGTLGRFGSDDRIPEVRSQKLDLCVTRLQPGMTNCPFHFHHVSEEMYYILEGRGTLRYGAETTEIRAGDVIACPPGPDSAHQLTNTGTEPLVYLAISTEDHEAEVCEYPDSGKIAVMVPGRGHQAGFRGVYRAGSRVDYLDGES